MMTFLYVINRDARYCAHGSTKMADHRVLASFQSQARGIKFYQVSTQSICVGDHLTLHLDPSNAWDSNCISLWMHSLHVPPRMLGNLAKETAFVLAPLLRSGVVATG